jgi:urease accessory protein
MYLPDGSRKLLLRDNMLLDEDFTAGTIAQRMEDIAVYGTLILFGPLFTGVGQMFMKEFKLLPRIGGKKWDSGSESGDEEDIDVYAIRRIKRQRMETSTGLLWSAASVRECVLVKFGAPTLEAARNWLHTMLSDEGSVSSHFGERALLCLK